MDLAKDYTVVAPDLRGYGWSSKPDGGDNHINYSKRTMAQDNVGVMSMLGFDNFALVGHDRGGRVARRLTLDHPERVKNLTVLDIVPRALSVFARHARIRRGLLPLVPVPASGAVSGGHHRKHRHVHRRRPGEVGAAYAEVYKDPAAIHAMCEDYRASAGMDIGIDEADIAAGKKIECPLNVLWGDNAPMGRQYDVLGIWQMEATRAEGKAMPGGHPSR